MSFEIGSRIFDYEVAGVLGAGGMGKVYKVRNVISDRMDAMKVLLPSLTEQPELADRFLREIKVLASLSHPGIAAFYTALRYENQLIMVMELVNGVTLSERLSQGPIPLQEGLAYMRQALSALGYAHRQGIIHRDIKPANMMLTPDRRIKLMDFGIAKAANDPHLTRTGTTVGSLYYISPEALTGTGLDARSDLYSLGITMYEVVTGKRPFEGKSEYSLMAAHLQEAPRPPIELQASLPPSVSAAILKALEKDPAKRFQTAEEFRAALEPAAQPEPAAAQPAAIHAPSTTVPAALPIAPQPAASAQQPVASHRGRYMLLGAIVAIILIVAAAVELPKWFRARATAGGASPAAQSAPTSAAQGSPPPAPQSVTPHAAAPVQAQVSEATPQQQPERTSKAVTKPPITTVPAEHRHGQESATEAAASGSATAAPPAAKSEAAQASAQHAHDQAAALQALEDRMSQLSGRANAAKTTVANLQQQETSSGLSLRPDVLASESRMERYMDQADSALSAHNLPLAKHNMDLAEREINNLQGFLGR